MRKELMNLKKAELTEMARNYGLSVTGKKEVIVERIIRYELLESLKEMSNEDKVEVINGITGNTDTIETIINTVTNYELSRLMKEANVSISELAQDDASVNFLENLRSIAVLHANDNVSNSIIYYFLRMMNYRIKEMQSNNKEIPQEMKTLVTEMGMKNGKPYEYKSMEERPIGQQLVLHTCRDLYLDAIRARKSAAGDKSVKSYGYVFVATKSDKYKDQLRMKDAKAKACVKAVAGRILSDEDKKKYLDDKGNLKQVSAILNRLHGAGLIHGDDTDKDYAKFYSVYPDKILTFLDVVGCLKK